MQDTPQPAPDNNGVGRAQVDPVFGGVVVEGEQLVEIIDELRDGLGELRAVGGLEGPSGVDSVPAVLGVPDLGQGLLGRRVRGFGERTQDVRDLSGEGLARRTTLVLVSSPSPSNRA